MTWAIKPSQIIKQVWRKYDISKKSVLPFWSYSPNKNIDLLDSIESKDSPGNKRSSKYNYLREEAKSAISNYKY